MSTFTPPTNANEVPGYGPMDPPLTRRLFAWSAGNPRGRNVYYLSDGTVTETDPDATNVFWSPNDFGYTASAKYVSHVWWGGHDGETVTSAQATALTNAGYTVV